MPIFNREYAVSLMLLALCGLLSSILVFEWVYVRQGQQAVESRLAEKVSESASGNDAELAEFALPPLEDYVEMVERPLFIESRKPTDEAAETAQGGAETSKTPMNLKLMGVIFTPEGKKALLVNEQGKYQRAKKDEEISSWKLLQIDADKIVLQQDDERQVLPLLKPKPKTASNQPAANVRSAPPSAVKRPPPPPAVNPPAAHMPPAAVHMPPDEADYPEDDSSDEPDYSDEEDAVEAE